MKTTTDLLIERQQDIITGLEGEIEMRVGELDVDGVKFFFDAYSAFLRDSERGVMSDLLKRLRAGVPHTVENFGPDSEATVGVIDLDDIRETNALMIQAAKRLGRLERAIEEAPHDDDCSLTDCASCYGGLQSDCAYCYGSLQFTRECRCREPDRRDCDCWKAKVT